MASLFEDARFCLKPRCPVCRQGRLFRPWTITPVETCAVCGARLALHDIGDGAAVFMMFILCFSLIPIAWAFEVVFGPPLWLHVVLWGGLGLGMIALMLPAIKSYIILLEHRHRPSDIGKAGQ